MEIMIFFLFLLKATFGTNKKNHQYTIKHLYRHRPTIQETTNKRRTNKQI